MTRQETIDFNKRLDEIVKVIQAINTTRQEAHNNLVQALDARLNAHSTVMNVNHESVKSHLKGIETHLSQINGSLKNHEQAISVNCTDISNLKSKVALATEHVKATKNIGRLDKFFAWILLHPYRSIGSLLIIMLFMVIGVEWVDSNNLISKILDWIIKVRFAF